MITPSQQRTLHLAENSILGGQPVKTVAAEDIAAPCVFTRPKRSAIRELRELRAKQNADRAVAGLTHDNEIYGFSKGQFSMLQLLEAILKTTGPVHFVLSTWTAARHEIQRLADLGSAGQLLSTKWLVDFTFSRRDPEAANQIRLAFGVDAIRVSQSHAKFALFANDQWRLVLRTSMNLNMNPRFEDFTIAHDPPLYDFLNAFIADIWTRQRRDLATAATREARHFWRDHM